MGQVIVWQFGEEVNNFLEEQRRLARASRVRRKITHHADPPPNVTRILPKR